MNDLPTGHQWSNAFRSVYDQGYWTGAAVAFGLMAARSAARHAVEHRDTQMLRRALFAWDRHNRHAPP